MAKYLRRSFRRKKEVRFMGKFKKKRSPICVVRSAACSFLSTSSEKAMFPFGKHPKRYHEREREQKKWDMYIVIKGKCRSEGLIVPYKRIYSTREKELCVISYWHLIYIYIYTIITSFPEKKKSEEKVIKKEKSCSDESIISIALESSIE